MSKIHWVVIRDGRSFWFVLCRGEGVQGGRELPEEAHALLSMSEILSFVERRAWLRVEMFLDIPCLEEGLQFLHDIPQESK